MPDNFKKWLPKEISMNVNRNKELSDDQPAKEIMDPGKPSNTPLVKALKALEKLNTAAVPYQAHIGEAYVQVRNYLLDPDRPSQEMRAARDETLHWKAQVRDLAEENKSLRNQQELEKKVEANFKARHCEIMNLIGEVIQEAQENPQRLVAFNSPLLNMLLLEYQAYVGSGAVDEYSKTRFRAVINARAC